MDRLTIGAVSRLTGIPTHTLRKWESRHNIVEPKRSESGRRFYNDDHVARLGLVKRLMREGHSLAELSKLNTDELSELGVRHDESAQPTLPECVDIVGLTLVPRLRDAKPKLGQRYRTFPMNLNNWLNDPATNTETPDHSALLVECDTVPDAAINALAALRQNTYERIVVVYTFAPRSIERALANRGIRGVKSPATMDQLKTALETQQPVLSIVPRDVTDSEFNPEQLSKIASLIPSLHCECPNHIAKLLIDINGFEQYCRECEDNDPKQRALHTELGHLTAQARMIFEGALKAVAVADNLDLESLL
jgi:DNA-binding transcriptional MerR regulator